MPGDFELSIVAPDREVVATRTRSVVIPGIEGYFGVQSGHTPMIAALKPGLLEYVDPNDQRAFVSIGGGFAEVSQGKMTILADEATPAQEINVAHAEEALEQARRALRGEESTMTRDEAQLEVERAMQRIKAARQIGSR
jgi:F-type H+-transporting ATPase subunit epsilon